MARALAASANVTYFTGNGANVDDPFSTSGPNVNDVTAALFLQRFARGAKSWAHLDIFGWAPEPRPGRPFGGTDQGIRAVYSLLKQRYS
mgnify:CR=1 FL=1